MTPVLRWTWQAWAELTPDVLYRFLRLRSAIFVVEQDCVFPEMDGRDPQCEHLCGTDASGALVREKINTDSWDGRNEAGERVASGVYIFVLTDQTGVATRGKILLINNQ